MDRRSFLKGLICAAFATAVEAKRLRLTAPETAAEKVGVSYRDFREAMRSELAKQIGIPEEKLFARNKPEPEYADEVVRNNAEAARRIQEITLAYLHEAIGRQSYYWVA